jgi:flagellar hook assembly protein FlgD
MFAMTVAVDKHTNNFLNTQKSIQRKTLGEYHTKSSSSSKMEEQIQKSKDFVIKMMFMSAKHIDPFSESSNNHAQEMAQSANLIAQLDSTQVQNAKLNEMAQAIKNQNFNATELQGKEVEYEEGSKFFDGRNSIKYTYNLQLDETNIGKGNIVSTIVIKNEQGQKVRSLKGSSKNGDHVIEWDGFDESGKISSPGEYTAEVSANLTRYDKDKVLSSPVKASTRLRGEVASVEIEDGITTNIVLKDGRVVSRDQIVAIKSRKSDEQVKIKADLALIDKKLKLSLDNTFITEKGSEIYYNNHIANAGKTVVKFYNDNQQL